MQPDLILGTYSGMTARDYELLSQIAPTVAQTDEYIDYGTPWQEHTLTVGKALGREDQARKLVADLEARFVTSLGFKVPAEIDQLAGDQFYTEISAERVDLLDADLLLGDQVSYLPGGRSTVEANPLVGQLTAMQDGRALFLPEDLEYAFAFNTVLSLPFLLDGVPMVEAAADGDPATVPGN
ncbi:MAG: ABC transporter substrate-binding protein [Pseudonocardiaceae bacterium]